MSPDPALSRPVTVNLSPTPLLLAYPHGLSRERELMRVCASYLCLTVGRHPLH